LPSGGGFGLLSESVLGLVKEDARTGFRNCDNDGTTGAEGADPGGRGGADPGKRGGRGADAIGGRGACLPDSGSERYDGLSLPVSTAPLVLRSFGMPPANIPASCGAAVANDPPSCPPSLLLLPRCPAEDGGAKLLGAGRDGMPGTGGALAIGADGPFDDLETKGEDRSLT